jgi:TPR repeat protein
METSAPSGSIDRVAADPLPPSADAPTLTPSQAGEAAGDVELTGTSLGRYELHGMLGAGGMGVVYRGRDPTLGRSLAIKLVRPRRGGAGTRSRLLREAQAMARLHHPNVLPIFDVGTAGGQIYLVMPFMAGGTLGGWLRGGRRPWRAVVERFLEAGRGLAIAHEEGLVHRDFKPENVLLGERGEVQVADFGLARLDDDDDLVESAPTSATGPLELTRTGEVLGTPAYMAPEQLRGEPIDARADQFAFCVSLHEGLYGRRPFAAEAAGADDVMEALFLQIQRGEVRPAPEDSDVPAWLRDVLLRGLRPEPTNRWPTMMALVDAIERRLDAEVELGVDPRSVPTQELEVQRGPVPARRPRRGLALAAVGLAAAGAIGGLALWRSSGAGAARTAAVMMTLDERCEARDGGACASLADLELRRSEGAPDFARVHAMALRSCDLDDAEGCTILGQLYVQGNGVKPDPARGRELMRQACDAGSVGGCKGLGELLAHGIGGAVDAAGAVAAWKAACEDGHPGACRLVSRRLRLGLGVAVDTAEAERLVARALELADAGCDRGDPDACRTRGMIYHDGVAAPRDLARAAADFERACIGGNATACSDGGQLYAMGSGVQPDPERGLSMLRRGCDGGDPDACESLAVMLGTGQGVTADPAEARRIAEENCERRGACVALAAFYSYGIGVPKDDAQALRLNERSCAGGSSLACWSVARELRKAGDPRAPELVRRSCDMGVPQACVALGRDALDRGDDAAAVEAYQVACQVGAGAFGCDALAELHFAGRGVPRDPVKGRELLESACAAQAPAACHQLAERLRDGTDMEADPRAALERFEQACGGTSGDSCAAGATLAGDGKLIPADPTRAARLRERACQAEPTKYCTK